MAKYLFTSDLRISELSERIQKVANFVKQGNQVSAFKDKSEQNNANTLQFYFNLYQGTETCLKAADIPVYAIRNYILKFQFPNPRTKESLNDSIAEKTLLAPYRAVVRLLNLMAIKTGGKAEIGLKEILYWIFCNPKIAQDPMYDENELLYNISQSNRLDYNKFLLDNLEWKQYKRQSREFFKVLHYASECFTIKNDKLCFNSSIPTYVNDKKFIDEVISYNKYWFPTKTENFSQIVDEYISYMDTRNTPYNLIDFSRKQVEISKQSKDYNNYRPYITAIKSKPFLLLAGISGTGKSRIVRELARACWEEGSEEYKAQKPKNFEMIQVKPNWHDSSELLGYVSRVSGEPVYVIGDFLKFVAKAWENLDVPHFLCLDEMNLAPVEQYFAEYLSVIESRKNKDGEIVTDAIIEKRAEQWYFDLTSQLTENDDLRKKFNEEGISIPQNLIVVGTVNMDETTFSFSRKVLDRAMTIEMNEVDLEGGLDNRYERIGKLGEAELIGNAVEGVDVYADNKAVCDIVINYLKAVNEKLEGTPFKIAYRTRNEFLLYVVNNLPYNKDENGEDIAQEVVIARALDEITSMKILSRIEGDETKVSKGFMTDLGHVISNGLSGISNKEYSGIRGKDDAEYSVSLAKLEEMKKRLESGYTSFWN